MSVAPLAVDRSLKALEIEKVSKTFGETRALNSVSFQVDRGEIVGLLGGNGSGKSTLVKVLSGVHAGDEGRIRFGAGANHEVRAWNATLSHEHGIRTVHQNLGLFPNLSITENLALGHGFEHGIWGIDWGRQSQRARMVLEAFEVDCSPSARVGDLRPADRTMVAIARAMQDVDGREDLFLILDEPTASLPAGEVSVLHTALRRCAARGIPILYISHRLDEVQEMVDRAVVLRDGEKVADESVRDLTRRELVALVTGLQDLSMHEAGEASASAQQTQTILQVMGVSCGPVENVSFTVREREVVGIAGLLGAGRTELLHALYGVRPFEGTVTLDGAAYVPRSPREAIQRGVAYVPEDRSHGGAFESLTVAHNVNVPRFASFRRCGVLARRPQRTDASKAVVDFRVKTSGVDALMASLSGGNQQKVILARWVLTQPRVLLLDEPTQGVDIGARHEIYAHVRRTMSSTNCAAVVVSSDFEELASVCDRVLVMRGGTLVADVPKSRLTSAELTRLCFDETQE